jgi:membrane protein YqaA with SNARE-associated domain
VSDGEAAAERGWLRRLYHWVLALSASPHAGRALAGVAFAESSFFPIPPDVMLVPMALARPERAWRYAAICTAASVIGGLFGYAIGALLFESLGRLIINLYGYAQEMEHFRALYAKWGLWIILIKGMTPIPYKLVTIASGFAAFSLPVFIGASIVTRGARFFLVAALLRVYGEPIRDFIDRRLGLVAFGIAVAIVGGFLIARYVV